MSKRISASALSISVTCLVVGVLGVLPGMAQTPECVPAPAGLVGWWAGDGTARDTQGGLDGLPRGGATFSQGVVDEAFSLDGIDDYIVIPNTAGVLDYGSGESFSWDAWFRTTGSPSGGLQAIIAKEDGNRPTFNSIVLGDGRVTCALQPNQGGTFDVVSLGAYDDGLFHHVACLVDGPSQGLTLVVDGGVETLDTTFPAGSTFIEADVDLLIGARIPAAPDRFFLGDIDEVEIFDRALTLSEVQGIFGAGPAGKCKDGDGDGFRPPDDCDDADCGASPASNEVFDGIDNDCDGLIDEGLDQDADGIPDFRDACPGTDSGSGVDPQGCAVCEVDNDGDGFGAADDCDDSDPDINPGAPELCNNVDDDCDGLADEGFDADADGFTVCQEPTGDCDDADPAINPDSLELPGNALDENCDGSLGACDPGAVWKNHGEFVRCVAAEVDDLIASGAITQEEGDALVQSAARSNVGKP